MSNSLCLMLLTWLNGQILGKLTEIQLMYNKYKLWLRVGGDEMEREASDSIFPLRKLANPYCQNGLLGIILIKIMHCYKENSQNNTNCSYSNLFIQNKFTESKATSLLCSCECKVLLKWTCWIILKSEPIWIYWSQNQYLKLFSVLFFFRIFLTSSARHKQDSAAF